MYAPSSRLQEDDQSDVDGTLRPTSHYSRASTHATTVRSKKVPSLPAQPKRSIDVPRKNQHLAKRSMDVPRMPKPSMDVQRLPPKRSMDVPRKTKQSMDIPRAKRSMDVPRMPKGSLDVPRYTSTYDDNRSVLSSSAPSKNPNRLAPTASVINWRFAREGVPLPPSPRVPDEFREANVRVKIAKPSPSRQQQERQQAALAAQAAAAVRRPGPEQWEQEASDIPSDEQEQSLPEDESDEEEPSYANLHYAVPAPRKMSNPAPVTKPTKPLRSRTMDDYVPRSIQYEGEYAPEPEEEYVPSQRMGMGSRNAYERNAPVPRPRPETMYTDESETDLGQPDGTDEEDYPPLYQRYAQDELEPAHPTSRATRDPVRPTTNTTPRKPVRAMSATTPRGTSRTLAPVVNPDVAISTIMQQRQAKTAQQAANPRVASGSVARKDVPLYDKYGRPLAPAPPTSQTPGPSQRTLKESPLHGPRAEPPSPAAYSGSRMRSVPMDDVVNEREIEVRFKLLF